jgi:hypothetical protein
MAAALRRAFNATAAAATTGIFVERGPRGGPYNPFSGPSRGTCDIWCVTVARFFLRRATAIQILRHLLHMPRDAQALAKKRANRWRPLDGKSKKIKASCGQVSVCRIHKGETKRLRRREPKIA